MRSKILYFFFPLLIAGSWLLFYHSSLHWFFNILINNYTLLNFILLALISIMALKRLSRNKDCRLENMNLHFQPVPFFILLLSCPVYLLAGYYFQMNILSCMICLISLYALSGLFIPYSIWKSGLLPVLLIIQTLPFGPQLDVYFGFPLRLHAAQAIGDFLAAAGYQGIHQETIITIENRSAEVSAACSGLNGLWTAWIFYFAITWMERKKPGLRWLIFFLLINTLIYAFNLLRILILVVLEVVYQFHEAAEIVHVPLGIAGFIFSCLITWFAVNLWWKKEAENIEAEVLNSPALAWTARRIMFLLILPCLFISLSFIPPLKNPTKGTPEVLNIAFPAMVESQRVSLNLAEKNVLLKEGCIAAKYHFVYNKLKGSCLVSYTNMWKGHHPPDLCIQGNGYSIEEAQTCFLSPGFPLHFLKLNPEASACYWFQSPSGITQDHAARVWSDISGKEKNWVMVSILFDHKQLNHSEDMRYFLEGIRESVSQYFKTTSHEN